MLPSLLTCLLALPAKPNAVSNRINRTVPFNGNKIHTSPISDNRTPASTNSVAIRSRLSVTRTTQNGRRPDGSVATSEFGFVWTSYGRRHRAAGFDVLFRPANSPRLHSPRDREVVFRKEQIQRQRPRRQRRGQRRRPSTHPPTHHHGRPLSVMMLGDRGNREMRGCIIHKNDEQDTRKGGNRASQTLSEPV